MNEFKFKSPSGYTIYKIVHDDFGSNKFNEYNICDFCNKHTMRGYLISNINSFLCKNCYEKWDDENWGEDGKERKNKKYDRR